MEILDKKTRRGVNAQLIAERCGCTDQIVYKIWDGKLGKRKTELYTRVMNLTKKVAAAYNEPQL